MYVLDLIQERFLHAYGAQLQPCTKAMGMSSWFDISRFGVHLGGLVKITFGLVINWCMADMVYHIYAKIFHETVCYNFFVFLSLLNYKLVNHGYII